MSSPADISLMHERKELVLCEGLETIVKMGVKIISCFGWLLTEKMSVERKKRFEVAGVIIRGPIVDQPKCSNYSGLGWTEFMLILI
jgi:hypothetical protein